MGKILYNITKEFLILKYCVEKLSTTQIATIIGCKQNTVWKKMKRYNITRRTSSEGVKLNPPKITYKIGEEHFWFGKKHSEETKNKIGHKNTKYDKNTYTKKWLLKHYHDKKLSTAQMSKIIGCSQVTVLNMLNKHNIVTRTFSEGAKLNPPKITYKYGSDNHFWRGGITSLYMAIRTCNKYDIWRKNIHIRDRKCVLCFEKKYNKLQIDHIKPFALILKENDIKTFEEALNCKELWDINNGRVLCKNCHINTNTYGIHTKNLLKESEG